MKRLVNYDLDEKDKEMLILLSNGSTAKNVSYEFKMNLRTVEKRIEQMKKYYNCKSITHLVVEMIRNNKIHL